MPLQFLIARLAALGSILSSSAAAAFHSSTLFFSLLSGLHTVAGSGIFSLRRSGGGALLRTFPADAHLAAGADGLAWCKVIAEAGVMAIFFSSVTC